MNKDYNIKMLKNVIYVIKNLHKKIIKLEIMIILLDNIEVQLIHNVIVNINKSLKMFKYSFIMLKVMIIIYYFNILMNLLIMIMLIKILKFYQKIVNNI
jgi:hypothetical protein